MGKVINDIIWAVINDIIWAKLLTISYGQSY